MRRVIVAGAAALGAILLAIGAPLGAHAYWQANATTAFAVAPATVSLTTTPGTAPTLNGGSGTAYTWINVRNPSDTALSVTLTPWVTNTATSITVTSQVLAVGATATCSAQTSGWTALTGASLTPQTMQPGAEQRMCVRLSWSGATSSTDGLSVFFNLSAMGSIVSTTWTTVTGTTVTGFFTGGPSDSPTVPFATCTDVAGMLANVTWADAPPGTYQLMKEHANNAMDGYHPIDSASLATVGWTLAAPNFDLGASTVYIVREGTTVPLAKISLNNQNPFLNCGVS